MEFKSVPFETKADLEERTFEGYAAAFGNVDSYGDIIHKGAFSKTIKERKKKIKVMYNHMWPVGMPIEMHEDTKGLHVTGRLSKTPRADEVLELMRDGVISEMSIGYEAVKWEMEDRNDGKRPLRHLKEIALFEVSPVDFAANEKAVITAVKELAKKRAVDPDQVRETIQALNSMLKSLEPGQPTPTEPGNHLDDMLKLLKDFTNEIKRRS